MGLSLIASETFKVEKYHDIGYGFLLAFYSNFVPKIFDFKNAVTLKTGLGSIKVIEKGR